MPAEQQPITYADAGVDVEAGDKAVELMKDSVRRAQRPEVLGGLGGFAGMFDASALARMTRPVLATSTDGVGTKVAIAQAMDKHDTIGFDLVGMVVDDIVVCGAEPLFMTDYIATGKVVPERIAAIVSGIAAGCLSAGVALIGGETAEHPGLLDPDEYDCAGAATGVVEYARILGRLAWVLRREGDALVWRSSKDALRQILDRSSNGSHRVWDRLGEIAVPVLIVRGTRSPSFSEATATQMLATLTHAKLLELDAAHNVPLDRPGELAEAVVSFARGIR